MGILSSFNIGITGMKAAGSAMNVTGDNIANSGTFGFKRSRAEFQDILAKSLKGIDGGDQMGSGTKLSHITPQFSQGTVNRTDNITDLAINGNGFFDRDDLAGAVRCEDRGSEGRYCVHDWFALTLAPLGPRADPGDQIDSGPPVGCVVRQPPLPCWS